MSTQTLPPPPRTRESGLGHDLASLACGAAIELDNLTRDPGQSAPTVRLLAERLMQELPDATDLTCPKYLVAPSTVTVMSRAISESSLAEKPTDVQELTKAARQIAGFLVKVSDDEKARSDTKLLGLLCSFCLLLSKVAAAARQSGADNKPQHPYRKQR